MIGKDSGIDRREEKIKLEAEKILEEIEEINRGLEVSKVPAWKSIREDRDANH